MSQQTLAIAGATGQTRCGYCGRRLVLQARGDWSCDRCRPLLAHVSTIEQFVAFQREAARS